MIFENLICAWNILDDSHKILLGNCLIIFGVIGLGLNIWLLITFLRTSVLSPRTYLLLLAYCIACIIRGLLVFPFASFSALLNRWLFGYPGCQLFGFLKLMISIFQIGCFTVLSIERLIAVRYYQKGTHITFKFYIISIIIWWTISILVASLPLLGFGRYTYDTTCTFCELDWHMQKIYQTGFNIFIFTMFGVLPILLIIICMGICFRKERKGFVSGEQRPTTKGIIVMIVLTFLFWTPRAILILWVSLVNYRVPKALAVMAPLSAEASTIIPALTYLVYLPTLRNALLTLLAKKRRNV